MSPLAWFIVGFATGGGLLGAFAGFVWLCAERFACRLVAAHLRGLHVPGKLDGLLIDSEQVAEYSVNRRGELRVSFETLALAFERESFYGPSVVPPLVEGLKRV